MLFVLTYVATQGRPCVLLHRHELQKLAEKVNIFTFRKFNVMQYKASLGLCLLFLTEPA